MLESFMEKAPRLLEDRSHSVLLAGVTLMQDICALEPAAVEAYRAHVPLLCRILRSLIMGGFAPDYDVSGTNDPFLQVAILRLLRLLGRGSAEASDAMSDVLAQVATNTDSARNPGNAILYECVQTIMAVESIGGLRVLAVNILGRFLANKDNNIRYVALNTLARVVSVDAAAVQRHRATIVDCVKDADISIRRRALELVYALVRAWLCVCVWK
jgi:AP-1 complex subunit gamma-1